MPIEATCWDFNAVVIADTQACFEADLRVIDRFGGRAHSIAEYRRTAVIPGIDYYVVHGCKRAALLRRHKEVGEIFHSYYEPRATKVRTRRGVRSALNFLAERNIPASIFSNHTIVGIEAQLKRLRLEHLFAALSANSDLSTYAVTRNKRERIQAYLERTRYRSANVLIIGDSPEEVQIGHALGLITVALTGGNFSTARLRAARPDHLISKVSDLVCIIKQYQ